MITTPVVYNFFIRPEISLIVFGEIKKVKPLKLFLISDGPRNQYERVLVSKNRSQIESMIDWECELFKVYFETNQGMDNIMESTYKYVFDKYDRMIFLEEDILPTLSFFYFCQDLLEKYINDHSIYLISGSNFLEKYPIDGPSYFYVENTSTWGMALWKRTYDTIQRDLSIMDQPYYSNVIKKLMQKRNRFGFYQHLMLKKTDPEKVTMDGEFWLMGFNQNVLYNSLAIVPSLNLVKNIGDTINSEHSDPIELLPKSQRRSFHLRKFEIDFPLIHPTFKVVDYEYVNLLGKFKPKFGLLSILINKVERSVRILVFAGYVKFLRKTKSSFLRYWSYSRHKRKFK